MKLLQQIKKSFLMSTIICTLVMIIACNNEKKKDNMVTKYKEKVTEYFTEYMSTEEPEYKGWRINSITFDTIGTSQYYFEVGEQYKNCIYGTDYQIDRITEALDNIDTTDTDLHIMVSLDVHFQEDWYQSETYYVGMRGEECVSCGYSRYDVFEKLCNSYEFIIYSTVKDIVLDQYISRMDLRLKQMGMSEPADRLQWQLNHKLDFYDAFIHHNLRVFFE